MTADTAFLIVSASAAGLLALAGIVALPLERAARRRAANGPGRDEVEGFSSTAGKYAATSPASTGAAAGPSFEAVIRVVWWLSIVSVLVGVGLSDAYRSQQLSIYAVGGVAAATVLIFHELLPIRFRIRPVLGLEIVAALALAAATVALTGYAGSPFVFIFDLLAVAVALSLGGWAGLVVAAMTVLTYLGVAWLDPGRAGFGGGDLLRIGVNGGSIIVLSYLATVYASGERRLRLTIERLWRIDHLTGLIRREELGMTLDQEVLRSRRSRRPFCLLMCDLDGLKALNDTVGHSRGDAVLRGVGHAIRSSIRAVDSAYRYGGDEFVVLLPETEYNGAFLVAEKIRRGVEEVGQSLGGAGQVMTGVSIGLVSYPEDGVSADELLVAADRAMYNAKEAGRNQISGNPRPARRPALAEAPGSAGARSGGPRQGPRGGSAGGPGGGSGGPPTGGGGPADGATDGDEEPDPGEVRRQIAAARAHMDPDHHVRRAMDAFLS